MALSFQRIASNYLQTCPPRGWPPGGGLGFVDQAVDDTGLAAGGDGEAVGMGLSTEFGEALLDDCRALGASGRSEVPPE